MGLLPVPGLVLPGGGVGAAAAAQLIPRGRVGSGLSPARRCWDNPARAHPPGRTSWKRPARVHGS